MAIPPALDLARNALFADLDGTLAQIRARPENVGPDALRERLLDQLSRSLGGAFAVVSGRSLEDVDRVLGGRVGAVAAVHGLVLRRAAGEPIERFANPIAPGARAAINAFHAANPSILLEDKGVAIALHYRAAPAEARRCLDVVQVLARDHGLIVQRGDMMVEMRAGGPDKGDAVTSFMRHPPFAGRTPVFIGDDFTDEDGFVAAERFSGYGVIVGSRRPTLARFGLDDAPAALDWLARNARCPLWP